MLVEKIPSRFKNSKLLNGWYEFTPLKSQREADLKLLESFSQYPVIVSLNANVSGENPENFSIEETDQVLRFAKFKGLSICNLFDVQTILENATHLECLEVFGRFDNSVVPTKVSFDLGRLENLRILNLGIKSKKHEDYAFCECKGLEHLFWYSDYQSGPDLNKLLTDIDSLISLKIHRSKIESLEGLQKAKKLKFLEVEYASKLSDLRQVAELNALVGISLHNCSKIKNIDALSKLKDLKAIYLESCKQIPSLLPIADISLEFLNFFDTNVADGDIDFLTKIESLKQVHFNQKRHYNCSLREIKSSISSRLETPIKWHVDARDYLFEQLI